MKKLISMAAVVFLLVGIASVSSAGDFGFGDIFGSAFGTSSVQLPGKYKMPDEFSITYEYAEDGKYREVTLEKDKSGSYHYKDHEDEYLFIKDGKGYRVAVGTVSGFVLRSNEKYDLDYVKTLTEKFWSCAAPLEDDIAMGTVTEEGSGEICGRKTKQYKVDLGLGYSLGGYTMSMSEATYYAFDAETNICLASSTNEDVHVMGLSAGDGEQDAFECIRFEIAGVKLPALQ